MPHIRFSEPQTSSDVSAFVRYKSVHKEMHVRLTAKQMSMLGNYVSSNAGLSTPPHAFTHSPTHLRVPGDGTTHNRIKNKGYPSFKRFRHAQHRRNRCIKATIGGPKEKEQRNRMCSLPGELKNDDLFGRRCLCTVPSS